MARQQEFSTAEALQSALEVFWRKGYEATSLADLLVATKLSKSSLYATFGNKRELFLTAFDSYRQHRIRETKRILDGGDGRGAIERFFRMIITDAATPEFSNGCMSINQAVEMAPHDDEIRQRVVSDFEHIEFALKTAVRRGKEDGSIKSTLEAEALARLLVLGFPGLQVMARAGHSKAMLGGFLEQLLASLDRSA